MSTKHPGNTTLYGAFLLLALSGCKVQEINNDAQDARPLANRTAPAGLGSVAQPSLYLLASNRSTDPKVRYAVTAARAPFFSYGPSQQQGADFSLRKGDTVTMVQRDFGYSRVRTANGREGFVATDQLTPTVPGTAEEAALPPAASMPASQLSQPLKVPSLDEMISTEEPPLPTGGATVVAGTVPAATPKPKLESF